MHQKGEEVVLITQPDTEALIEEDEVFDPFSTIEDMPLPNSPKV